MRPTLSPTLETHPGLSAAELRDVWMILTPGERFDGFSLLPRGDAEEFFLELDARDHAELVLGLPAHERRVWMRLLPPDDAADLTQAAPAEHRAELLGLLDKRTRTEVMALLAYAEDEAGGLMNPRFARLRPDATVDEAIGYLRRQARGRIESIYYGMCSTSSSACSAWSRSASYSRWNPRRASATSCTPTSCRSARTSTRRP
jgi:magnesium transporter